MSLKFLMEKDVGAVDVDSEERVSVHRRVLERKRMIREVFNDIYDLLLDLERRHFGEAEGLRLEIGAGSSMLKDRDPAIIKSDVVAGPGIEKIVDAQALPFADKSLRTIFGVHCFHHIPDPYRFLDEIVRTCRKGGGAILVEPYHGPLAAILYKHLFANEDFDKAAPAVREGDDGGPMSEANQALSYIVFDREHDRLARDYPALRVVERGVLDNYLRYLISGGVNFRQLLPDASIPLLRATERVLRPCRPLLGLHHYLVIKCAE